MKKTGLLVLLVFLGAGWTFGQAAVPSLIPLPQSVQWSGENFRLSACKSITINNASLEKVAADLRDMLKEQGISVNIKSNSGNTSYPEIILRFKKLAAPLNGGEAYALDISKKQISILANSPHGIFNGIQTLRQLITHGNEVPGCRIKDWPAFSWRGYMVDVGRNYQSVGQLKQQIRIMSRYKFNIFHFHLTENIAWRLQIKRYPQLTAPENMLRNKGQYYTIAEMNDLIQYCRDRFITLVPEIDMPGHSDAFTRAFGVNMQSEKGADIVKNILTEVDSTYHVPALHIGADEVRFTNKNFIPEVVNLIHSQGKQTIGWDPGGNYDSSTIRQLWENAAIEKGNIRYIDSRSLYLNHMDPLESVVSIFERELCGVKRGDEQMLGGEICLWNDRRVEDEKDLLRMNPVYPAMLAFSERSWRGGGYPGAVVDIGAPGSERAKAFLEFETRLTDHKKRFFKGLPFPYVRQGNIQWKLFGPFTNDGDLQKKFWPEAKGVVPQDSVAGKIALGGTIILRHWWYPALSAWLDSPKENTTWYGARRFWSDTDTIANLWIGFNDLSRSPATDEPQAGAWDDKSSCVWLNDELIPPPHWNHAGEKGNSELPLSDEGYSYRTPTKVHFKKGWNDILVKAPVGSFRGKDWQNPVKWMFTVVKVSETGAINLKINQ